MIDSKAKYREYIKYEYKLYFKKKYVIGFLIPTVKNKIWSYQKTLRKCELFFNTNKKIRYLFLKIRLNKKGISLNFDIGLNCFDKGLHIYHIGSVIVNPKSHIGENCTIIGTCCIGGKWGSGGPTIGKNCELGINSSVIGEIVIGDNTYVGAGAVVTKSFTMGNCKLVGVPAHTI